MKWFDISRDDSYLQSTEGFSNLQGVIEPDLCSNPTLISHLEAFELNSKLEKGYLSSVADWLRVSPLLLIS